MASTIDDALFVLHDTFGDAIGDNMIPFPSDMTVYSLTQDYPLGTTRRVYDTTKKCWAVFRYLKVTGGTEGNANGMAVKSLCGRVTTAAAAGTAGWPFTVTPDGGECMLNGPIAIALGTISAANFTANTSYYGWFQSGGSPAVSVVPGLDGNYATDTNVAANSGLDLVDDGDAVFGLAAAADIGVIAGFSGAADAA